MKRFFSIVVLLALVVSMFTACGNQQGSQENTPDGTDAQTTANATSAAPADEKVTITYWTLNSNQEQIENITKEFNDANPNITVNVTYNITDDQKKNLKIAASSKTLPDIWRNWGGSLGSYYPENGLSYDLTQYAKDHNWADKFLPSSLTLATFDGQLSGRPFVINALGMFYRKDIFQKYGIQVPATFEEMESAMATLKQNGVTPISTGGKFGWHCMRILEALIEMYAGSSVHDKLLTLEEDWSKPEVVKAFAKYKEWIDKGYFPDGFLTADPNETRLLVYAGTAAMDIQGPWYETNILEDDQDINNYGFFNMPLKEGANRISAFIEMVQFNKNIGNKLDAAMKYVDYTYTPEVVSRYNLQQPLPYQKDAFDTKLVLVPQVVDAMNKNGTFTIADQGLPQEVVSKLFEAQDNLAVGKMTPEQAAKFMQDEATKYKNANK